MLLIGIEGGFAMKINERYEIKLVVGELTSSGIIGDIYDNFKDFKDEHPNSPYDFGYIVFDNYNNSVAAWCNDWNDSPEEALSDYCRDF